MELKSLTDEALVEIILNQQEIFGELIDRYEKKLRRYVARITQVPPQEIDDLLQDIFIKVYQNLHAFDASFPFSSWIYRIARNTAISAHRKRVVRPELQIIDSQAGLGELADDLDIEADLRQRELHEELGFALTGLRPDYQEVLILRFFEDKSYEEMSDIMMKPSGTIATLLNRAKTALRKELVARHTKTFHEH